LSYSGSHNNNNNNNNNNKHQLIKEKVPTFKYEPDVVLENTRYRIMWDLSVITDKTISANRPDIIMTDHVNKYTY
jgi:hypothetical protein